MGVVAAADPNLTAASGDVLGYLTDNGPIVVGVVAGFALFGLGIRWVASLTRGRSPVK